MPFYIHKPYGPKKTFILNRGLSLTADGKVVESTDPAAKRVLGVRGHSLYEDEAKHYGLDESYRLVEEKPAEPEAAPEAEPEPEEQKGHLPEDFPGYAALAEAGINTYGQLRKLEDVTTVPGIGPATAEKIKEALAE